jgi:transcription termination factor Rho
MVIEKAKRMNAQKDVVILLDSIVSARLSNTVCPGGKVFKI